LVFASASPILVNHFGLLTRRYVSSRRFSLKFKDVVIKIISLNPDGISPPDIQREIERKYPEFFGTKKHSINVEKGHYTDLHHALKAQVYGLVRQSDDFICDKSVKPFLVSLSTEELDDINDDFEDFESATGKVYVLKTGTFTQAGKEILKIGHTTQSIEKRISQLYTTGVPFQFSVYKVYETKEHIELESALHKLLSKYRLNKSREFFTEDVIPYVEKIIEIHNVIQCT
jgi:hypothetical protein